MPDFLDTLATDAVATVKSGYYRNVKAVQQPKASLKQSILNCKTNAVITEIKAASPSLGTIREAVNPTTVALAMQRSGAAGISVLTEPKHFNGSIDTLVQTRAAVNLPLLMKDFIISMEQIDAAAKAGANTVLLIEALFERGYCEMDLAKTVAYAHHQGLEVLLETHTEAEFKSAVKTDADLIGINNRNLATLKIDLGTTQEILQKAQKHSKMVISESGVQTAADLRFLRGCGADGFLVGSSIMLTDDIEGKVKEFVKA